MCIDKALSLFISASENFISIHKYRETVSYKYNITLPSVTHVLCVVSSPSSSHAYERIQTFDFLETCFSTRAAMTS
jgi:hypothetical protein